MVVDRRKVALSAGAGLVLSCYPGVALHLACEPWSA
jgi:hypothetical protein